MNTIAYPWVFLLYIPFLIILYFAIKRPLPSLRIPSLKAFSAAQGSGGGIFSKLPFILYVIGIAVLIFALSRPRKGTESFRQRTKGIDIILAIDLSGSMMGIDVPKSITTTNELARAYKKGQIRDRLETAKVEIKKFIERRPNDRIGLIAFAERAYSVCPPTLDHTWLIENLDRLKTNMIGSATGIAPPIASGVKRLKDSESKRKLIVLFTDGSNTANSKITPIQAAKLAKYYGVTIYTVGIGSNRAYVPQMTPFGMRFLESGGGLDEKLLKNIAKETEGLYYTAADGPGLKQAMEEINSMEKTTVEHTRWMNYSELAPKLINIALGIMLIAFLLENSIMLRLP